MKKFKFKFEALLLAGLLLFSSCEVTDVTPDPEDTPVTENITVNTTWTSSSTYIIEGNLSVEGATLTIEPGAVIKFKENSELAIGYSTSGSSLIANGTSEHPITFTSAADNPSSGDWDYIYFGDGSTNSSMSYCNISYGGGYNDYSGIIQMVDCHVSIDHCDIQHSTNYGIALENNAYFTLFTNNNLSDISNHPIKLDPNSAHTLGIDNTYTTGSSTKGILVDGGTFNKADETWLKQSVPYVIDGTVYIQNTSGAKLTIEAGTTVSFTKGSQIEVGYGSNTYGTIIAEGTALEPITFTSAAPEKTAGDWDAIFLEDGTSESTTFNYCVFEYGGGYNSYTGIIDLSNASISLNHCIIRDSETFGISCNDNSYFGSLDFNTFEDCFTYPITIYGNWAHTIGANNVFNTTLGPIVKGDNLEQTGSVTWNNLNKSYYIDGTLYIQSTNGTTLIIEKGTQINFTQGSQLEVGYASNSYGSIIAQGTVSDPIIFTSGAPEPSNGDWDGIFFEDGTMSGTIFDFCEVSYAGGYNSYSGNVTFGNSSTNVTISNSTISHSSHYGLYIDENSTPNLTNITYLDNTSEDTN
ncbi:MAG: hypothetical protein IMY72_07165 [Bacteroidetes bacterium]|nr:hypothetical protein [Bacteroidota bacterium]